MGIEYVRRRFGPSANQATVQTVTSTGTVIASAGLSIVAPTGTTADKTLSLSRPAHAGQEKTLVCRTTGVRVTNVTVAGATASGFFEGTTFRTIVFSSLSTKQRSASLMAFSTNQWSITSKSTGASLL